jgi:hypothetical protein
MYREKKHVKNYVSHSEIDIHLCEDRDLKMFVCNDCKCSYKNLWGFKHNQCLDGCLCYDYLENPSLYMEHGGQDDGYEYLQNDYLHVEPDNFAVDKTNLSVIKSDENHCKMAQSAETNDLIENTDWGGMNHL